MSVKVTGNAELMAELEKRFGVERMREITDKALIAGAKVFRKELLIQLKRFRDTGATIDEVTISKPYDLDGVRTIRIHWKGPRGRYRIIHLNEWGTIKNPNPAGKGKIALALRASEQKYRDVVRQILMRDI